MHYILQTASSGSGANPNWIAIVTAVGIISSAVLGFLGYRKGVKADQSLGISKMTELALHGQADLVDQLQEEVGRYRAEAADLHTKVNELYTEVQAIKSERDGLQELISKRDRTIKDQQETIEKRPK